MGTPTEEVWQGVSKLKHYKSVFPQWAGTDLANVCPELDDDGIDLLSQFLVYDPALRISPKDALKHQFFDDMLPKQAGKAH
ncbi:MAG: hypothetical protein P4M11_10055 [Candidatus Pacebacteria bacterium]|nr:hypothetical protein [Candidatus Paceibacterota bacterium]